MVPSPLPCGAVLKAAALRIAPKSAGLDPAGWDEFFRIVEAELAARPPVVLYQVAAFLALIRAAPVLRWGRTFERLDGARQDAFLRGLQDSRLQTLRVGFWGLRALVLLGYYGRPGAGTEVGYAPSLDGNAFLS